MLKWTQYSLATNMDELKRQIAALETQYARLRDYL